MVARSKHASALLNYSLTEQPWSVISFQFCTPKKSCEAALLPIMQRWKSRALRVLSVKSPSSILFSLFSFIIILQNTPTYPALLRISVTRDTLLHCCSPSPSILVISPSPESQKDDCAREEWKLHAGVMESWSQHYAPMTVQWPSQLQFAHL